MLSIAPGYDPRYLTRQVGQGAENYYLSAVVEHGEPPGRWWGPGAAELGLEPGSEIDGPTMETLYEKFLDPRDPDFLNPLVPDEEKARLGRKKSEFKSWKEVYEKRLAAEPEASPERRKELEIAAKGDARQNVIHHDATFSPSKSVTLVHAGLLAAAVQAETSGDVELAGRYRDAAQVVEDGILIGAEASLRYLQEHAGEARTGYHGAKVAGRTTGRWTEAGGWVVARFFQHTNREGEPQLHVHQAILNRQLCADGKWRGLDGMALYRVRPAAAAHGERAMEEYHTRRLGLEFVSRPDGNGREVVGVTPEQIMAFSSRRTQALKGTPEAKGLEQRVADYIAAHGREPSPRLYFQMAQEAVKATKSAKPKAKDAPSRAEELAAWEARTVAKEIGLLSSIPGKVLGRLNPERAQEAAAQLADIEIAKVLQAAVADAQRDKASFTRYEVTRYVNRHLPDCLGGLPAERVEALLEQLTDLALDPAGAAEIRLLTAPDVVNIPEELRRADGRSVYLAQACERYTTADQLDREAALTASALAPGALRIPAERVAEVLGLSVEQAKQAALEGQAVARPFADQAEAITGILISGRRVDVLLGAAGTGKSFTMSRLAEIWRQETGTPVIGLTTSQNAAGVLHREGLDAAMNITRWLHAVDEGETSLLPGQMVVVDEASMVTTEHLVRIQQLADAARAKVVWTGDPAQLAAPGAGGAMRHVVEVGGSQQLSTVVRFTAEWEREASVKLREGLAEALTDYDQHGRLQDGGREEMETAAYQAYLADFLQGKQTLLLAGTNDKAAELSARVRAELVALGRVDAAGVPLRDGNTAGRGDLIMARRNVINAETRLDELTNRDVLQVGHIDEEGRIVARVVDPKGGDGGEVVTLDPDYVREHVELGYASTVHAAQGRTVDTCYSVVDETGTRQMLYVMLTRGRDGNYAYVVVDRVRESDLRPGPQQSAAAAELLRDAAGAWSTERTSLPAEAAGLDSEHSAVHGDRISVLSGVLETDQADQTAVEAMLEEGERPRNLAHLGSMWIDQIREHTTGAFIDRAEARGALNAIDAARLRNDEAAGTLGRLLHTLHMSGRDADRILGAAVAERDFGDAESVAQVLHWRISKAAAERGIDVDRLEVCEEQISGTWRDRTPVLGRPVTDRLLGELAGWMQLRSTELGQDALERPPAWLVETMGEPHPEDAIERETWAERAGRVMAYREQYGYSADTDAIGPAPSRKNPEQRAAYFAAHDAIGRPDTSREITGATDGELWVMRAAYERDARLAPRYVGDELGRVTTEARERAADAVRLRAQATATASRDPEAAAALNARAAGQETLAAALRDRQDALTEIHEARQAWHRQTKDSALLAGRADAELRRREHIDATMLPPLHVDQADARVRLEQQQTAEREAQAAERGPAVPDGQLELDLGPRVERAAAWSDVPARPERSEPAMPGTFEADIDAVWDHIDRLNEMLNENRDRQAQPAPANEASVEQESAEAMPEHDQTREQMPGQTVLELFTDLEDTGVDRDIEPELADAVDKARAARTIADVRQAQETAEVGAREAESDRRRREAEREKEVDRRAQERADAERARLEERTREQSPAAIVEMAFPTSIKEAVKQSPSRHHEPPEPHRYEGPSRDIGGPSL